MEEREDEGENRGVERFWEMTTMMTDEGRIKKIEEENCSGQNEKYSWRTEKLVFKTECKILY